MVGSIGIMIGFYIFTRMQVLLARTGERKEPLSVRVFAVITALVTLLMLASIFLTGVTSTGAQGLF